MVKFKRKNKQDNQDNNEIKGINFIPINSRKFIRINLDYTDKTLFKNNLSKLIPNVKDAFVLVNIRVYHEDYYKIDFDKLNELLSDAYYIVKGIKPTIIREKKQKRIKDISIDQKPLEVIESWLDYNDPKYKDEIFELAKSIIKEVGINAL